MIQAIESCVGLNISQVGLLLDIFGFLVIFIFGGFQLGVSAYIGDESNWYVLPLRIAGSIMVIIGFAFQIVGSGG